MLNNAHDVFVSIPLYCKMAGISMNELDFESYTVKLKPEYNNYEWIENTFNANFHRIINAHRDISPPEDSTYKNFFLSKSWVVNEA